MARVTAAAANATFIAVRVRRPAMDGSFERTLRLECLRQNGVQACNSQSSEPPRRLSAHHLCTGHGCQEVKIIWHKPGSHHVPAQRTPTLLVSLNVQSLTYR